MGHRRKRRRHRQQQQFHQRVICDGYRCWREAVVSLTVTYGEIQGKSMNLCPECWAEGLALSVKFENIKPVK